MKKERRIIALLLAVCMLASMLVIPTNAVGTTTLPGNPLTDEKNESSFALPDIIEEVESENASFVGRITENEPDLNTFVFDNGDGTYTMKVYSHPVKFIDADGEIKDITTDIKAVSGGFQTADNNIITTFSQKITDGITLEYDDIEIKMIPAFTSLATASVSAIADAVLSNDGKSVNYSIDSKTSYEYELTYMGFKEDIVVNEYTGQTEYSFILYTNGLSPVEIGGSWFMEDADGNIKATVGDIIIFTADERNNTFGSMSWQTVKEDQIYAMTIHLDAEYLSNPATVYPIRIDPTIEINYDNDGAGAIEDIVVNSEDPHLGSETYLKIGTHPDDNSTSRALMRFPNLDVEGFRITSSQIFIRDIICQSTQTPIECHEYTGAYWTESAGINWSGVTNASIGDLLDTLTVYYGNGNAGDGAIHWYGFDITDLAVKWSSGAADPAKGVIFKATDAFESSTDKYYKTFASYNRANYKPYISVDYIPIIELNYNEVAIDEGTSIQLIATTIPSDEIVTWVSSDETIATVNESGLVTGNKAGCIIITAYIGEDSYIYSAQCVVYVCIPEGIYYIKNNDTDLYMSVNPYVDQMRNADILQFHKFNETSQDIFYQLWKVKYIGGGFYSIRPLCVMTKENNLDYGLGVNYYYDDNDGLYLKSCGSNDNTLVAYEEAHWSIVYDGSLYAYQIISQVEVSSEKMYATAIDSTLGGAIFRESYVSTDAAQTWLFELSSIPISPTSLTINNSITFFEGQIVSLSDYLTSLPSCVGDMRTRWSSSDDNILSVNSLTGKATARLAGSCFITARNLYSGVSTTIKVHVLDSKNVYHLRNAWSGKSATVYNFGLSELSSVHHLEVDEDAQASNQIWRIELQSNGYYKIYPMHTSDMVLSLGNYNSDTGYYNIVISNSASTVDAVYWEIDHYNGGRYFIISKVSNNIVLSVDSSAISNKLVGKAKGGSASYWYFDIYENDSYWGGGYIDYETPNNVLYSYNSIDWDTEVIPSSYISNVASHWNNISPNVRIIYNGTSTNNSLITYESGPSIGGTTAITIPIIDGVSFLEGSFDSEDLHRDWDCVRIQVAVGLIGVYIENGMLTNGDGILQAVLVHEMGHALKLTHPREIEDSNNAEWQYEYKATYPCIMQPLWDEACSNYLDAQNGYMTRYITNFDKSALISKWKDR